jgi:hypothetical protein
LFARPLRPGDPRPLRVGGCRAWFGPESPSALPLCYFREFFPRFDCPQAAQWAKQQIALATLAQVIGSGRRHTDNFNSSQAAQWAKQQIALATLAQVIDSEWPHMPNANLTHPPEISLRCGPDDNPSAKLARDKLTGGLHQPGLWE